MIHSSEYPQTTFAVLDSMKCLVGENSLDTIFGNLRQFYNPKKGQKIEVKGYIHEAKGYVVKIGSIVIGSTNKGLIVEVSHVFHCKFSYQFHRGLSLSPLPVPLSFFVSVSLSLSPPPSSLSLNTHSCTHTMSYVQVEDRDKTDVASCWGPLTEFTRGLLDYSPPIDPPAFSQTTNRPYKSSDSMIHYAFTFKQLRRPMAAASAMPPIAGGQTMTKAAA